MAILYVRTSVRASARKSHAKVSQISSGTFSRFSSAAYSQGRASLRIATAARCFSYRPESFFSSRQDSFLRENLPGTWSKPAKLGRRSRRVDNCEFSYPVGWGSTKKNLLARESFIQLNSFRLRNTAQTRNKIVRETLNFSESRFSI